MRKTRFKPVFKSVNPVKYRSGFRKEYAGKKGVYLISENGKIVYVGHSLKDLYKIITRHFQSWKDASQVRITYQNKIRRNDYKVRIVTGLSDKRILKLEKALVIKLRPRDNDIKYDLFTQDQMKAVNAAVQQYNEAPF